MNFVKEPGELKAGDRVAYYALKADGVIPEETRCLEDPEQSENGIWQVKVGSHGRPVRITHLVNLEHAHSEYEDSRSRRNTGETGAPVEVLVDDTPIVDPPPTPSAPSLEELFLRWQRTFEPPGSWIRLTDAHERFLALRSPTRGFADLVGACRQRCYIYLGRKGTRHEEPNHSFLHRPEYAVNIGTGTVRRSNVGDTPMNQAILCVYAHDFEREMEIEVTQRCCGCGALLLFGPYADLGLEPSSGDPRGLCRECSKYAARGAAISLVSEIKDRILVALRLRKR